MRYGIVKQEQTDFLKASHSEGSIGYCKIQGYMEIPAEMNTDADKAGEKVK